MAEILKSLINDYDEGIKWMRSQGYVCRTLRLTDNIVLTYQDSLTYPEVKIYKEKDNTVIKIVVPKIQIKNVGSFFFPKKIIRDFWILMRPGGKIYIDGELKSIFLIDNKYKAKSQVQFIEGVVENVYCLKEGLALKGEQILQIITTCPGIKECKFEVELDLLEGLS